MGAYVETNEEQLLDKLQEMCAESLDPEAMEMAEVIQYRLRLNRHLPLGEYSG